MKAEEAFELLKSTSPHDRLRAARYFVLNKSSKHYEHLRHIRQKETVAYVKRSLDLAISRNVLERAKIGNEEDSQPSSDLKKQIHTNAVEEVTGKLLHEIEPRIGQIKESAKNEITDYEHSRTKLRIAHLERIVQGIQQLRSAALFDMGITNKAGHTGFGLAIAKQAIDSLNGSIDLQPSKTGGVRFEIHLF